MFLNITNFKQAVTLSFLLHAAVFLALSLPQLRKRTNFSEYRIVQLMPYNPRGTGKAGGARNRDIKISKPSKTAPSAAPLPRETAPSSLNESGEDEEYGSPDGVGDYGSYLPFFRVARMPEFVTKVVPVYPARAKLKGIETEVLVEVYIDTEGKPRKVVVIRSGGEEFDRATTEAVSRSTFSPALSRDGEPVPVRVRIPFKFELE